MPRTPGFRDYGTATWHIYSECPQRKHTGYLHPVLTTEGSDANLCDLCRREDQKDDRTVDFKPFSTST
jgi:hypothetical protein